jgi:O-antigen/teichoic acid export membrane protein
MSIYLCGIIYDVMYNWVAHLFVCLCVIPHFDVRVRFQKSLCGPLISYGGWVTVSNVISPLMEYFDRFMIGALLSMAAVTYYATPYDVVIRVAMIPMAICGVLFPVFSGSGNVQSALTLFNRGVKAVFVAVFPILLIVVIFAEPLLVFWIGRDFAQNSEKVLRLLAMGLLANCLALVPLFLIQGLNRPDITAKIHICELPLYLLVLWWLLVNYGIIGVALAWAMRTALDAIILFSWAQRLMPNPPVYFWQMILTFSTALGAMVLGSIFDGLVSRLVFVFVVLSVFAFATWRIFLTESEREEIMGLLKRRWLNVGRFL